MWRNMWRMMYRILLSLILLKNSYNKLIYIFCNAMTTSIHHEKPGLPVFTVVSYALDLNHSPLWVYIYQLKTINKNIHIS